MPTTHKVFISFHNVDEWYKFQLERVFSDLYHTFISQSVADGDINPYLPTGTVRQQIRDKYLRDSTVTIVLVGAETWKRKHVDWEISASIRQTRHSSRSGLLGILLPTYRFGANGTYSQFTIPPRLYENIECKFAAIYYWPLSPADLHHRIHEAYLRRDKINPNNSFPMFVNNRSAHHWQY